MSDKMNQRQATVLRAMRYGDEYTAADIARLFSENAPSPATLRRDMQNLKELDYVTKHGEKRATRYGKTVWGALHTPYDVDRYYVRGDYERNALERYQFGYLGAVGDALVSAEVRTELDSVTQRYHERRAQASVGVQKRELERFVIEFSWKSSAIEGNTYTLLDTERLLKEGVEADGHRREEATMILNHKTAFAHARQLGVEEPITRRWLEELHARLVEGLGVAQGVRRGEVGILGTQYRPPAHASQIEEELEILCRTIDSLQDSYSRALLALVGTSYLQPFEDGNKRTARLFANALLLQRDCAPLSYRDTGVRVYRESMLVFYEQLALVPMREIFRRQYQYACEHYLFAR